MKKTLKEKRDPNIRRRLTS